MRAFHSSIVTARRLSFVGRIASCWLVLASIAAAQTTWYWDNFGGTANDWQSVDNWSLDATATTPATSLPDASGVAQFNATTLSTVQTVNANGDLSVLGINFVSPAAVTLQGGGANRVLTLGASGITKSGTGVAQIGSATANQNVSVLLGAAQTWTNNAGGNLNVLNAVNNDGFGLTIAGSGVTTMQGAVTGGGSITKSGSGTLILSSTLNTFSGGLTVNGGTAAVSSPALAAGGTTSSLGSGRITINSGGTVFLNINATNSGTMGNSWTLGGGTLRIQDGATVYSGGVTVSSASVIEEFWGDTQTFNGAISGAGGLTFRRVIGGSSETPAFVLNGNNTITGTFTVGAGAILRTGTTTALGNTSAGTVVQSGGALDLFGKAIGNENVTIAGTGVSGTYGALVNTTGTASLGGNVAMTADSSIGGNGQLTLNGALSGSANLTKVGTGLTILAGTSSYTGVTALNDGSLRINAASALGPNATIVVTNTDSSASNDNAFQLANGITVGAGKTLTLRNTATGTFANARTYLDNASGTNTWAGDVRVEGGSNQGLRSQAGLLRITGSLTNSGTLPTQGIFIRGNGSGEMLGLITLGTANLFKTDPGTWTVSSSGNTHGALSAAHGVLVANANNAFDPTSTLTLGQTTSSGTFTINAGFSQEFAAIATVSSTAATGYTQVISGSGSISTGSADKTLTVYDNAVADDLVISAGVVGTGTLVRAGAGTLAFAGIAVSAPLRLDAGTTRGDFTAASIALNTGATLAPGGLLTSGTITTGGLAFDAGTQTLAYTIGDGYSDLINVTGSSGLTTSGGLATFAFTAAGALTSGSTYTLINYVGTSPGLGGFTTTTPGHASGTLVDTGSSIAFTVTEAGRVIWTGATNNVWDINATPNWKLQTTGVATNFLQGDNVLFDDTGINPAVQLSGTVQPSVLDFDNSTVNYEIGGGGVIAGMGAMQLRKLGSGTVTLNGSAPHTFTGPTVVSAGELAVNSGTTNASPLAATSGVSVASGATLRAYAANQSFTFSRNLTGSGTVVFDPNAGGTPASQNVTLSGSNSGFTGTLIASPLGDPATNGTMRIQVTSTTALGAGAVVVRSGGQLFISSSGTFANPLTLAGYGYQEVAGGVATTFAAASNGTVLTVPAGAYSGNSGIGALRADGGATVAGPITLASTAKISPYNATMTIAGDMTAADSSTDLVVGGVQQASTTVLTGNNSGLGRIWLNGGVSGTTGYTQALEVGTASGTSGSLGVGQVVMYADVGTPALRFQRADGYTLAPGQTITAAYQTIGNATKPVIDINTRGAGLSVGVAGANTIDLLDASGTTGGRLRVGTAASGSGAILNLGSGATVRTRSFYVGDATSTGGTVNQSGGTVTLGGAAADTTYNLRVGHWSTEFSTYNLTGGSITFSQPGPGGTPSGGAEVAGGIYVGIDGVGTFNQSGGDITTGYVVVDNRGATTTGTSAYNLSSGTLAVTSQWGLIGRNASTSAFTWSGGTIRNAASSTAMAINTPITQGGDATLDTVDPSNSFVLMNSISGSGTITTTGGGLVTLNPDSNTVRTGTSTGTGLQSIDVPLAGSSGITKVGTGTTTLSAVNTYTGPTTVNAGVLVVSGSAAGSAFTVNPGGVIAGEGRVGDLTFTTGSLSLPINAATGAALTSANLTTGGASITVSLTTPPSAPGPITVLSYTGAYSGIAATDFLLSGSEAYRQAVFTDSSSSIVLDTGNKSLVWNGSSSGTWNTNGNVNWDTPETEKFFGGDLVTFNDAGAATTVEVSGTVVPWGMTVSSATANYTIVSSAGNAISGPFNLLKTGASVLTMSGTTGNSFTGGSTIREGVVRVQNATSLGSGTIQLGDAGTGNAPVGLYLDANRSSVSTPVVVSGSGTGSATLGSTYSGEVTGDNNQFTNITLARDVVFDSNAADRTDYENIGGTGNVTVTGSGRSIFVTTNTFIGNVAVTPTGNGNLQIGVVSGASNFIPDASVVTVTAVPGSGFGQLRLSASSETIGALAGNGVVDVNAVNGTLTVGGSNVSGTFAGAMQDFGANTFALTKSGSGVQVLTGSSSYSGATTVAANGGVLRIESPTALSPNSQVSLAKTGTQSGALLFATSGTNTFTSPFAGLPSSNGLANGGTPGLINAAGNNTLTRNLTVNAGGGNGANIASDGGLLTLSGTLQNNGGSGTRPFSLGGSGSGVVSGPVNNGTITGSNVASVIKHGGGTWSLTNAGSTFTGGVNLLDGVLEVTSVSDTGVNSSIGSGGDITFAGAGTAGTLRYAGATDQSTNRAVSINATGGTLESAGAGAITFTGPVTSADPVSFAVNATGSSAVVTNTAQALPTVRVGMTVTSTSGAFPAGTTVTAINGNAYTLSSSATATAAATVTFGTTDRTLTLAGVNTGRNTVAGSLADSAAGGRLGIVKNGVGAWVLSGSNSYSGPTAVNAGTLFVDGIHTGTGSVSVAAAATLAGTGTVGGATTLASGATLSPGASPGTLSFAGDLTWNAGGNYNWQMLSGTGSAGATDAWDLVSVAGTLAIASTSADPFKINLWTLSGVSPDVSGTAANFDSTQNYSWKIASAAGGISGFASDKFVIATSATNGTGGFANGLGGGVFSVAQSGNDLNLVFTAGSGPAVITINVASGTQTQTAAGYPLLSGSVPVQKTGNGTLVVDQANTLTGSTTVQGGVLQLANGAALSSSAITPVAGGTLALTPYLQTTVGGLAPNAGGLTDVGSGAVTVASGLSAVDLVTALLAGRGDGSWNGTTGITSSQVVADLSQSIPRTIGWLDNGDGSVTFSFAAAGDTNLDWNVDILDAANFLAGGKFDSGEPASWIEGDFGYDGFVDILDAADFLSTGLFDAGFYNPPAGSVGVAAVPEPASWGLLAVAGAAAVRIGRRRRG